MRGSIVKRGSRYSIVVELDRDPETGQRRQRWHSGYRTKREAEAARTEILARLQRGEYVEPSRLTFGDFIEREWLPAVRHTVRPLTFADYESKARNHLLPRLGDVPLQRLTASRLNAMYGELLADLKPSTVRQVHAVAYQALAKAVRWNYVPRNVADDADPPRLGPTRELRTWTADELRRFLDSIRDQRLYALYHLLAQTGARRGEALGARWEDFDGARWTVCRNLVPAKGRAIESTPKTATGRRSVALDPTTVAVLREWRRHQLEERLAWGPAWRDTGRTFTREDGTDLAPGRVSETFTALVAACEGLPRIRLHDLRHTHATLALQAGVHVKVVAERLGHSSVKVTLDTYSHAIPAMQADAAARIAALIE